MLNRNLGKNIFGFHGLKNEYDKNLKFILVLLFVKIHSLAMCFYCLATFELFYANTLYIKQY